MFAWTIQMNKIQQKISSKLLRLIQIGYDVQLIYTSSMAKRLQVLNRSINSEPKYVDSSFDYLIFETFLTPEQNTVRKNLRNFLEKQIKESIIPFIETSTFPEPLIAKLRQSKIAQYFFKPPYGKATSLFFQGVLMSQLARIDAGLATFYIVQAGLLGCTVQSLGSQQQKAKYLPKIINLEWIGGWGLTQDKIGSDATNIQTTVTKTSDGYKLNGVKRWMGNGNKDLLIVWAKNENKLVQGFILQTHNNPPGWKSQVIKNKLGLRIVQNCNITLDNVKVKEEHKLPFATDFQTGTNKILKHSRPLVCWIAVGVCIGVYDNAIQYTRRRKQFGKAVAHFQLVQEKLVRIMSNIQAMLLLAWRICSLYDSNKADMGQIALAKAWITERGREVCKLGRQICGGNGLLHQNYVMRAMTDIEAIYTYEGSYEVNVLVAGRDLTGFSAFVK